jgi:hypothetical protein
MAPEYATDGLFSVKSDVFSFGVLLMEIISGKRSRGYYNQNQSQNLIGYVSMLNFVFANSHVSLKLFLVLQAILI